MEGLEFIPLLEERFDLVIRKEAMETQEMQMLLRVLRSPAFRSEIAAFSGNDYRDLGKVIMEV
jgi:putative molybdopterin biosynthesis protein